MERVCALPVDLHGRDGGNGQVDGAAKAVEPQPPARPRRAARARRSARPGRRRSTSGREVDLGLVALRQPDEPRLQPGRRARQEEQEPGRERIECPRMPRPRPGPPPHRGDDRERRRAGGLVDEDDSARLQRAGRHYRSAADPTCAETSAHDEVGDLLDRELAREPGGLAMTSAARFAGDRAHVDLVDRGAQRHLARRGAVAWRLRMSADTSEPSTERSTSMIPSEYGSVAPTASKSSAHEMRHDDLASLEHLCALERAREELELRELDVLVDALEDAVDVGPRLDEVGGEPQCLRRRVRVLEPARIGHERDVQRLGDLRREREIELSRRGRRAPPRSKTRRGRRD